MASFDWIFNWLINRCSLTFFTHIPAMGMIYYFKKYNYTKAGAIKAFIASVMILGLVQGLLFLEQLV